MWTAFRRPDRLRRGVTLVEMMVVVALVVLMMVILVQIFQQATGAMTASRAIQDLDLTLRQLDQRLKQDLGGATAKFTPPLDPSLKLGYFEYGENAFADLQGEDTDDYIAFTTKAPEGQVFTGRFYVLNNGGNALNKAVQPITITSQLAEVIYFLRNGNLYRRVFLIVPERQSAIVGAAAAGYPFPALKSGAYVSWLGANDISARPSPTGPQGTILLNDLGDLTNRENRRFSPRFRSQFFNTINFVDDDSNGDDVPDFYPTLYPNVFNASNTIGTLINEIGYPAKGPQPRGISSYNVNPFPYIFPGMYSKPENTGIYSAAAGWIHSLDPSHNTYLVPNPGGGAPLANAYTGNHAPLATGDNLNLLPLSPIVANGECQTWWGFPTWRETLSTNWRDPAYGVATGSTPTQQTGLVPIPPLTTPAATYAGYLPQVTGQYANDTAGSNSSFSTYVNTQGVWDDDLICTNVRSFDVKAFDPAAPLYATTSGYYDLGYGIATNTGLSLGTTTPTSLWDSSNQPQGFGHAGRMPPLVNDNRLNPSRPLVSNASVTNALNNIGDNGSQNLAVIRLTRVWDSWSTDYTNAPATDVFLNGYPGSGNGLPIYPSYPAPYTSPLRGIQIKIRVNDPRGDYVKDLTIRHDFTDKL